MIRIRELDHIVLRVREPRTMIDFYCDVLGCRLEKRQETLGLIQLRAGSSLLDLVPIQSELVGTSAPTNTGISLDHFCFRIDPFDAGQITDHLSRYGIDAGELSSRYGAEGMGPSIYIKDPEGNTVELKGPPDPSTTA